MKADIFAGAFALLVMFLICIGLIHQVNSHDSVVEPQTEGSLRLATYNVHYILMNKTGGPWSVAGWEKRRTPLNSAVKSLDADIIGFQEMESFVSGNDGSVNLTRDWLLENNPEYAAAAIGDWQEFPSTQPIFYRKDRLSPIDQGWFFFSETPEVIYSRTFNGSYPAFASWARFEDKTDGQTFIVYNVHLEFKSSSNRLLSAKLIAERIKNREVADEPVFLLGDLNAMAGFKTVKILENEANLTFRPIPGPTYHWNMGLNLFGAIDHVGYSAGIEPEGNVTVLQQQFNDEWPTDHYPVIADFRIN